MARKITHTLMVEGDLLALTPFHVGGAEERAASDMPLALDGLGRHYPPGTSIGGALRAFCRHVPDHAALWGYAEGADDGAASRLLIDDAHVVGTPMPELWHGNGVDRRWGVAAERIKYDREVLPRGTRFRFRLALEVLEGDDIDARRAFLAWLIGALEDGRIALGAGSTRGLGRIKLVDARCLEHLWSTPEGRLDWFASGSPKDQRAAWREKAAAFSAPGPEDRIRIEIDWSPRGPLMSKSARDGIVVDALPFLSRLEGGALALALPGAGIKGALRTHAERIVRTVTGRCFALDDDHRQVDVPLAADLFGRARPAETPSAKTARRRRKGRLAVETCYAKLALPQDTWDRLEREEEPWRVPPSQDRPMSLAMHVAIDRWTGGAAKNLLFGALEPGRVEWAPIVMHLDASCEPLAELALLWLTLRDLYAGRIPVGFGANRGYGDLAVRRIALSGLNAIWDGPDSVALPVADGVIDATEIADLIAQAEIAWRHWLEREGEET